jgi:4-carboxymuconolactone decarboxylase
VTQGLHDELAAAFGEQGVVEIVTTIGYYSLISLTLNAFEVPLSTQMDDPWPEEG